MTDLLERTDLRPMGYGRRNRRGLVDPIFEPLWAGRRVILQAEPGTGHLVAVDEHRGIVELAPDLRAAIADAVLASSVIVEGVLVPGPLGDGTGAGGALVMDTIGSNTEITKQFIFGRRPPNEYREALRAEDEIAARVDEEEELALVVVDLLELDGTSLLDVPLQERRRLLESSIGDGGRVRRTMGVRAPVEVWYAQWKSLGFRRVAVKAANSRYEPGVDSKSWATEVIPLR